MLKGRTIKLGAEDYPIHPLNIGEMEELADHIAKMTEGSPRDRLAATRQIIAVALRRDRPELTDDEAKKIEATMPELNAALLAVLELAGFIPAKAPSPASETSRLA